ncbi:MAG: GGDEF domain-containing protein [Clostridiales bacterium]|nr:GGDEF domain-containing protein [Clostridiales bacterium]
MSLNINDIHALIKVCQNFDDTFADNEIVELFASILDVSKVSYRVFFNDVCVESAVVYHSSNPTLGEEFSFQRMASDDRLIVVKIFRASDAIELTEEETNALMTFGETVLSGICVKNLVNAYEYARYYDSLTGLTNVNYFLNHLDALLASDRYEQYSVACVNIKNCGSINRIFGSDITDSIIKDFAQDNLDLFDYDELEVFSRLSSDSFIMIVKTENTDGILTKLNNSEVSVDLNGDIVDYNVRIRAGIVNLMSNNRKSSDVIHLAEHALAFSRLPEYPDIYYINGDGESNGNLASVSASEINNALKSNQLLVYYRPIVNSKSSTDKKTLIGAEAVVRWKKDGRMIDPIALIPSAGNNNLIRDINDFVFRKVCETINGWEADGVESVPIAIKLSAFDYFNTAFADNILRWIDRSHIDRSKIILEFDEESFHGHYDEMKVATDKFTSAGVRITISNYGDNKSSLKLLGTFNFDFLKLNPDLLNSKSAKDIIIVENIIAMAHRLGYEVICVDPVNEDKVKSISSCGCSLFQGDIFDKALSERFFRRRLSNPDYSNSNK